MTNILDLNDHCLLEIFDFCKIESLVALADSCSRFNKLIESKCYRKIRKHSFVLDLTFSDLNYLKLCVIEYGRMFAKIGSFIESFSIEVFSASKWDDDEEVERDLLITKLFDYFGKNVCENIHEMDILFLNYSSDWLFSLHQIFRHVRSIKIRVHPQVDLDIIVLLLPRLEHLHIRGCVSEPIDNKSYFLPSLKSLAIGDEAIDQNVLIALLRDNPQLDRAKIACERADISQLCQYWKNLAELTLYVIDADLAKEIKRKLFTLEKLQKLFIKNLDDFYD